MGKTRWNSATVSIGDKIMIGHDEKTYVLARGYAAVQEYVFNETAIPGLDVYRGFPRYARDLHDLVAKDLGYDNDSLYRGFLVKNAPDHPDGPEAGILEMLLDGGEIPMRKRRYFDGYESWSYDIRVADRFADRNNIILGNVSLTFIRNDMATTRSSSCAIDLRAFWKWLDDPDNLHAVAEALTGYQREDEYDERLADWKDALRGDLDHAWGPKAREVVCARLPRYSIDFLDAIRMPIGSVSHDEYLRIRRAMKTMIRMLQEERWTVRFDPGVSDRMYGDTLVFQFDGPSNTAEVHID